MKSFRLYSDATKWLLAQAPGTTALVTSSGLKFSREDIVESLGYDVARQRGLLSEYKSIKGLA